MVAITRYYSLLLAAGSKRCSFSSISCWALPHVREHLVDPVADLLFANGRLGHSGDGPNADREARKPHRSEFRVPGWELEIAQPEPSGWQMAVVRRKLFS